MKYRVSLIAGLALCVALAAWVHADENVTIRSDSLEMKEDTGEIRFAGGVEVRLAEAFFTCDLLTVKTGENNPAGIRSGTASGSIVLVRGADRVEAQKATFDLGAGKVELTGAPRLVREDTVIEAEKIVYTLEKGTASFEGPVRALFKAPEESP